MGGRNKHISELEDSQGCIVKPVSKEKKKKKQMVNKRTIERDNNYIYKKDFVTKSCKAQNILLTFPLWNPTGIPSIVTLMM